MYHNKYILCYRYRIWIIISYVFDGQPKKRFLCFLETIENISEQLTDDVLTTLALYNIDSTNMRRQSYDNISNMSRANSSQ